MTRTTSAIAGATVTALALVVAARKRLSTSDAPWLDRLGDRVVQMREVRNE